MSAAACTIDPEASAFGADWEVSWFKQFLRFNTSHPNPNYQPTVAWLLERAKDLHLEARVVELVELNPIVVLTLVGKNPSLPSVAFNCHMDVVPVESAGWCALPQGVTPFDAWEDPTTGNIYARGAQDMKVVGASLLCALGRWVCCATTDKEATPAGALQSPFQRTLHLLFTPDEEVGGLRGVARFVQSEMFQALHIGVLIDEGLAHEQMDRKMGYVYYAERHPWWGEAKVQDCVVGHGSNFNALPSAIDRTLAFAQFLRQLHLGEYDAMQKAKEIHGSGEASDPGTYASVNITVLKAGVTADGGATYQYNQIPGEAQIAFDMRVPFHKYESLQATLADEAARCGVELRWIQKAPPAAPSPVHAQEQGSQWFHALCKAIESCGVEVEARVFPAATDARYLRQRGIPAYGFSPLCCTVKRLHDHNEYVARSTYLDGIAIYDAILRELLDLTL